MRSSATASSAASRSATRRRARRISGSTARALPRAANATPCCCTPPPSRASYGRKKTGSRSARHLGDLTLVLPWGTDAERARSERLAAALPRARVPERAPLDAVARLIAGAQFVVGVDTGLMHLAAALGVPLVAIFSRQQAGPDRPGRQRADRRARHAGRPAVGGRSCRGGAGLRALIYSQVSYADEIADPAARGARLRSGLASVRPRSRRSPATDAALLSEVRRAFTLHGKPIPPEIFRDFGDGDLADSGLDLGHRRYRGGDRQQSLCRRHQEQRATGSARSEPTQSLNGSEETGYAVHRRDGQWTAGRACELQRRRFRHLLYAAHLGRRRGARLRCSTASAIAASISPCCAASRSGDRWDGEVSIAHNAVRIVTTRSGPADAGAPTTQTIAAERP